MGGGKRKGRGMDSHEECGSSRQNASLLPSTACCLGVHDLLTRSFDVLDPFEHGSLFEEVGHDNEPNRGTTDVDHFMLHDPTIPSSGGNTMQRTVHVVLCIRQMTSVHCAILEFHHDGMAYCFMQQLDRNADTHCGERRGVP